MKVLIFTIFLMKWVLKHNILNWKSNNKHWISNLILSVLDRGMFYPPPSNSKIWKMFTCSCILKLKHSTIPSEVRLLLFFIKNFEKILGESIHCGLRGYEICLAKKTILPGNHKIYIVKRPFSATSQKKSQGFSMMAVCLKWPP